jgi:alpha-ribazole phosphatase
MTIKMTRVYLIRHGETDFNRQKRYCGHSDVPLNQIGTQQAKKLWGRFRNVGIDVVYSSDLKRAQQTAEIVFAGQQGGITLSALLRELNFGQWEGLTYQQILAKDKELYKAWLENPAASAPPDGESLSDLNRRLEEFVTKTLEESQGKAVAIVSHAGPIRTLLCNALGMPLKANWRIAVDPASVSIIEYHETVPCVWLVNDTCHLESTEESRHG